jgi:hypothetical protein
MWLACCSGRFGIGATDSNRLLDRLAVPLPASIAGKDAATPLAGAAERYPSVDIPALISTEFERYLCCGILRHGFARVCCPPYRNELRVEIFLYKRP